MAPNRRFGQNFLISKAVREKIIELLELSEKEHIWEIGPGLGAMTKDLIQYASQLTLFEIDNSFVELLESLYAKYDYIKVVPGDVVKTWKSIYQTEGQPDRIMGNLPYNTASVIIADLIEAACIAPKMVFTVQKEVAARMKASPGTREYSAFSVLCQFACTVKDGGTISPGAFYPKPHVDSTIVVLHPHGKFNNSNLPLVGRITRALFSARRKTIRNTLGRSPVASEFGKETVLKALESCSIDAGRRGEELSVEQIVAIAEAILIQA